MVPVSPTWANVRPWILEIETEKILDYASHPSEKRRYSGGGENCG